MCLKVSQLGGDSVDGNGGNERKRKERKREREGIPLKK